MHDGSAKNRIYRVFMLSCRADEQASAKLLISERRLEEIKSRQEAFDGVACTLFHKRTHCVAVLFVAAFKSRQNQVFLGVEVSVKGSLCHTSLGKDQVYPRCVISVPIKQSKCSIDQMSWNFRALHFYPQETDRFLISRLFF